MVVLLNTVSCSLPQTFKAAEYDLEFLILLASTSQVLKLQACNSMPKVFLFLKDKLFGSPDWTRIRNPPAFASTSEVLGLCRHAPYLLRQALVKISNIKLGVI